MNIYGVLDEAYRSADEWITVTVAITRKNSPDRVSETKYLTGLQADRLYPDVLGGMVGTMIHAVRQAPMELW